ncbi:hypothetical protein ACMDCR_09635 [Labrys okinawensis]|uniref:hypothetical protein n=1 Tax=Labrys okinawensis TaxID=346911 RepID=UPI0039BCBF98
MQLALIVAMSLHVLAVVFWAGTGALRGQVHASAFGAAEKALALGAICAVNAAGVQGAVGGQAVRALCHGQSDQAVASSRLAMAQRFASGLLAVTIICMASARYV